METSRVDKARCNHAINPRFNMPQGIGVQIRGMTGYFPIISADRYAADAADIKRLK